MNWIMSVSMFLPVVSQIFPLPGQMFKGLLELNDLPET